MSFIGFFMAEKSAEHPGRCGRTGTQVRRLKKVAIATGQIRLYNKQVRIGRPINPLSLLVVFGLILITFTLGLRGLHKCAIRLDAIQGDLMAFFRISHFVDQLRQAMTALGDAICELLIGNRSGSIRHEEVAALIVEFEIWLRSREKIAFHLQEAHLPEIGYTTQVEVSQLGVDGLVELEQGNQSGLVRQIW